MINTRQEKARKEKNWMSHISLIKKSIWPLVCRFWIFFSCYQRKDNVRLYGLGCFFRLPAIGCFSCVHSQQKCWGYNIFYQTSQQLFFLAGMHIPLEPVSSPMTIPEPCSSHCSPHWFADQEVIALPGSDVRATWVIARWLPSSMIHEREHQLWD